MSPASCAPLPFCAPRQLLRDGSEIAVRPLEPWDAGRVSEVFAGLGPASRYQRFLAPKRTLTASDLRHLLAIDHQNHEAVAALSVDDGATIGIARFLRLHDDGNTADLAVAVVDAWQRRGVGTALMTSLVTRAQDLQIGNFSIIAAPSNRGAVRLMRQLPGDAVRVAVDRHTAEFVVSLVNGDSSRDLA